jgi:hypothetical protein
MNPVLILVFFFLTNGIKHDISLTNPPPQDCIKAYLGKTEICLPKMLGMKECYNQENIKSRVDEFKLADNTIHGYYLNDSTYKRIDNLGNTAVSDCFKVYSVNQSHSIVFNNKQLNELFDLTTKNYLRGILDSAMKDFSKRFESISFNTHVLIKVYKPHTNIKTALSLTKVIISGKVFFFLMTYNLVIVKDRLLFYSYYLKYEGIESIKIASAKNDYYGLKIIELNK